MKRLVQLLAIGLACSAYAQGSFQAIEDYATGGSATVPGTSGWIFQTTENIYLNALGAFNSVVTAQQSPVTVGIWNSAGALLASAPVSASDTLVGQTRYVPVNVIELVASESYHLGAYSPDGALLVDFFGLAPTDVITMSPLVQLVGAASFDTGLGFPPLYEGGEGFAFLAPNFSFTLVPEPSTLALAVLGGLLLVARRRLR